MKISNLPDREFKVMGANTLKYLRRRLDEQKERLGMLWNSFGEDSITLTPQVDKDITHTQTHSSGQDH